MRSFVLLVLLMFTVTAISASRIIRGSPTNKKSDDAGDTAAGLGQSDTDNPKLSEEAQLGEILKKILELDRSEQECGGKLAKCDPHGAKTCCDELNCVKFFSKYICM
jgi:hypothetical protein